MSQLVDRYLGGITLLSLDSRIGPQRGWWWLIILPLRLMKLDLGA